jgi:PAS domain S-box-containing protein
MTDHPSSGQRLLQDMGIGDQAVFLASILESSTEYSIIAKDLDGLILAWNEGARRIYGYEASDVVGKASAFILHHAEDVRSGRARAILEEVRQSGKWEGELRRLRKNGTEFTAHVTITLRRDAAGQPIGFTMISRDLTESQRIDRELRESQEYNRGLIESNIDALMTTDVLGIISDVNRQMCEMTGHTREHLIGTAFNRYFTEPKRADEGIRRVLAEDRVTNYELTMRARDGKEISKDITEQKALEEQLRRKNEELEVQYMRVQEANRLKSEFLANMSHELRTPLNAIIGFTELLHDGKVGAVSGEQKEFLGDILTSSRHLLQLINDVLDLSKVESGKMEFRPESLDLERVVGEVRDILRSLSASKRIRVDTEIAPNLGDVLLDPGKLKQVLYNYLSNALKFTPDEGQVTVRVVSEGPDHMRLEVEDTGIGIRAEDMPRLFVEFQQLDASTGKKYAGTGLGLALTKRIVEAQEGRVGVSSTPGQGSTFFAVLPLKRHETTAPTLEAPTVGGGPTVLVVEDDQKDRAWLARTLTGAGYGVETASTGAEGIELARSRAFDAITLDLLLPDLAGREVLEQIRAEGPNRNTPVIVVTVVAERSVAAGFGVQDILVKPVAATELLAALGRARVMVGAGPILIVEDNPKDLRLIQTVLHQRGYRTVARVDGGTALEAAREEAPGLIILDLRLPGMDGFQFLQRFRSEDQARRTPVIVWTGKDLTLGERRILVASAQKVVLKGDGPQALLAEMELYAPVRRERGGRRLGR